jgi:hypothetical protein
MMRGVAATVIRQSRWIELHLPERDLPANGSYGHVGAQVLVGSNAARLARFEHQSQLDKRLLNLLYRKCRANMVTTTRAEKVDKQYPR